MVFIDLVNDGLRLDLPLSLCDLKVTEELLL